MSRAVRTLGEVVAGADGITATIHAPGTDPAHAAATPILGVVADSRAVAPGVVFCCLRGDRFDGHDFASAAQDAGASALLVDHVLPIDLPQIVVADTRLAVGPLASSFHGHPSRSLIVVGITGTNGKTTTANLLAAIFDHAGLPCGVIGTLTGRHTTPEAPELQARLADFISDGRRAVVMEVSSHALTMHRVDGTRFAAAVFTNLGRDHLDLHGTIERYFAAKAELFRPSLSQFAIVNVDDVHGKLLADAIEIPVHTYSASDVRELAVTPSSHSYAWRDQRIEVGVGGDFNAMNSLAAATTAAVLGLSTEVIAAGLRTASTVPGRFESVLAGQPFDVIVDYAHTPDGLREVLLAARRATAGSLVVVVGCGGDRDREKRPLMGAVAAELADRVVFTSDNPRSEDPISIINAMIEGVPDDYRDLLVIEPDRRRALEVAFRGAHAGDIVIVAGKGHETTQTIGSVVIPFDDRAVARELLEARP